jgi:hypothetical protein
MDTWIGSGTMLKINRVNPEIPSVQGHWRSRSRAVTLYLARKRFSAVEIHATLGFESVSYPCVTYYLHQAKFATLKQSIFFLNPNWSSVIQMRVFYLPRVKNPSHRCDS